MLIDTSGGASKLNPEIFSKRPLLQISALKKYHDNDLNHLDRNKLSDKLDRRDFIFYDTYKLGKSDEVIPLQQSHFPHEGILNAVTEPQLPKDHQEEDNLYGDIELKDFN